MTFNAPSQLCEVRGVAHSSGEIGSLSISRSKKFKRNVKISRRMRACRRRRNIVFMYKLLSEMPSRRLSVCTDIKSTCVRDKSAINIQTKRK